MAARPGSKFRVHICIGFLSLLVTVQGWAQNCEAILGYVRDTSTLKNSLSSRSSFRRFFCDQTFSSFSQARDMGLKLGIVLDGLPIEFGGHNRDSQWSEYKSSVCESVESASSLDVSLESRVSKANADVVRAWSECVNTPGVHFFAESNATDPKLIRFVGQYHGLKGDYRVQVSGPITWNPTNAMTCKTHVIGKPAKEKNTYYFTLERSELACTRNANKDDELPAVDVQVKTASDDRTASIPLWAPPEVTEAVSVEKHRDCPIDDTALHNQGNDGLVNGTYHRWSIECAADEKITHWESSCSGPGETCKQHVLRTEKQDGKSSDDKKVYVRWWLEDNQPLRTFTVTVYWKEVTNKCVKHCRTTSVSGAAESGSGMSN